MAKNAILITLAYLSLFGRVTLSIPSLSHNSSDEGGILPHDGVVNPSTDKNRIEDVYMSRKKRYITERGEGSCCRKEPNCSYVRGEIVKDCKCKKCSTGVPAFDGISCTPNCLEGERILPFFTAK